MRRNSFVKIFLSSYMCENRRKPKIGTSYALAGPIKKKLISGSCQLPNACIPFFA